MERNKMYVDFWKTQYCKAVLFPNNIPVDSV